jgi:PAS domain S-box-containing protein
MKAKNNSLESLRQRAGQKLVHADIDVSKLSPDEIHKLIIDLQIREIELEIQNEELLKAQAELQIARDKYVDLYDFIPVGYLTVTCIKNSAISIIDANKAICELLGIKRQILIGSHITKYIDRESQDNFYLFFKNTIEAGHKQIAEILMHRTHGTPFYARLESKLTDNNKVSIAIIDISDRKRAEETLYESQQKLQLLLEQNPGIVWATDRDMCLTLSVGLGLKSLGEQAHETEGKTVFDILHTDDPNHPAIAATYQALSGKPSSFEIENQGVLLTSHIKPLRDNHGKIVGTLGMCLDITERKKAEEALVRYKDELEIKVKERTAKLKRSEKNYRLLVQNANEAVLVFQDRRVKYFNPKAIELFGYSPKTLISKPIDEFLHPDNRELVMNRHFQRLKGEVVPNSYDFKIINKQGDTKWVRLNAVLIKWEEKPAVLGLIANITEQKKAEEGLVRANEQLKQYGHRITQIQEEERKRIAYELHDDTAQYLSILKLEIESLLHSGTIKSQKVLEKLEYLMKDAERAFNDVRRYSHELRPGVLEHLGLQAALEQIAEDINKLKQIKVELHIDGEEFNMPEEIKLAFFRIAQEALNNARKHAKASKVNVDLRYSHNRVSMTVSDNGIGFDKQEIYQKSGSNGSLGLMSMRERANLINADLKIESETGKGTKVKLKVKVPSQN